VNQDIKISIIGLGYVGLPLAIEFSNHFPVVGFDLSKKRVEDLKNGIDINKETIKEKLLASSNLKFSFNTEDIAHSNIFIITVPTPVNIHNVPDLDPLKSASEIVGRHLKTDDIIIYESTVYPGATEEICVPILEKKSKLKYNVDFFCGYSPERINPGDKKHSLSNTVKITSGSNPETAQFVDNLYNKVVSAGTHAAASIRVAEAAKVIENVQRDLNIALVNELAIIFNKLGIDSIDVFKAAETKWNFMPFRPGLVGGHCIGVDPYYLTHKAIEVGYNPEVILAGRKINEGMGGFIADIAISEMTKQNINSIDARVAILGITFKENCPDIRNTKVMDIFYRLGEFKSKILVNDPWADKPAVKNQLKINLVDLEKIKDVDCLIICVAHDEYKKINLKHWEEIVAKNGIIIDVKSIFDNTFFEKSSINHKRI
tara:strand:+ start:9211 stop:10500 length:1290 start_codon:yes stop_codon:yes gene_type:complete